MIEEFLHLHYGRAAETIRRYLDLVHDTAEASGQHNHCFGAAWDYGLDAETARRGLELFEEGMQLAETPEVRDRVEKASIACHAILVERVARP